MQQKKKLKIDKDSNEGVVTISYKIKFITSARFRATSLLNLADKLTERIHKIKFKDCDCFLEFESVKDNLIKCKCLSYQKLFKQNKDLKKRFKNAFKFSNNHINKLILLLRKDVTPYISPWMIGKILMQQHYLQKEYFIATLIWKMLQRQITCM